jgi:hypothetical protein
MTNSRTFCVVESRRFPDADFDREIHVVTDTEGHDRTTGILYTRPSGSSTAWRPGEVDLGPADVAARRKIIRKSPL